MHISTANTCPTLLDVSVHNLDVFVAIRSRVFVPESDHMTKLVNDNAEFVAVLSDRYSLGSSTSSADVGTTTENKKECIEGLV